MVVGLLLVLGLRPAAVASGPGDVLDAPLAAGTAPHDMVASTAEPPGATAAQTPPGFRPLAPGQTAYTRRGGAYVRAAPSADAELLSQLFYDTPLPLLGAVDAGGA